jgi:hypothetical protein
MIARDCLTPRNCSHEPFPFTEAPAKAKITGSIELRQRKLKLRVTGQ